MPSRTHPHAMLPSVFTIAGTITIGSPPKCSRPTRVGTSLFSRSISPSWPCAPQPQVYTSPSTDTAVVCLPPAATMTILLPWECAESMRVDTSLQTSSPCPRRPKTPEPKVHVPSSAPNTAVRKLSHATVMPLMPPNEAIYSTVGTSMSWVLPCQSSPSTPLPHVYTVPSCIAAAVCSHPAATITARLTPSACMPSRAGSSSCLQLPYPSCPSLPSPHAHTVPSSVKTKTAS